MRDTRRLTAAALVLCLTGCVGYRHSASDLHRSVPTSPTSAPPTAAPPTSPRPTPTTVDLVGDDAKAVAARLTVAYFDWHASDPPDARRRRCRPFDTDSLDQLLGVPSWAGAANDTPSSLDSTAATVDAVNQVEATPGGVGLELAATVTYTTAGASHSEQRGVQLWVVPTAAGWRVAQMSVAS